MRRRAWRTVGLAGIVLGIALTVVRAPSWGDAILGLQLRLPRDPIALAGNLLVLVSALLLVVAEFRGPSARR